MEHMNLRSHKQASAAGLIAVALLILAGLFFFLYPRLRGQWNGPAGSSGDAPLGTVRILACGVDESERHTDLIMLASIDFEARKASILRIPRDSFVGWDYPTGKINAVYSRGENPEQGMALLADTVEEMTGLRADYYATVTLSAFRDIIDNLGGIEMEVSDRVAAFSDGLLKPGLQLLDGGKAEWFVRNRASYLDADIGRIAAQDDFMLALVKMLKSKGSAAVLKAVADNYSQIHTDIPVGTMLNMAKKALAFESADLSFFMAEGAGVTSGGYAIYNLDADKLLSLLNAHFYADLPISAAALHIARAVPDPVVVTPEPEDGESQQDEQSSSETSSSPEAGESSESQNGNGAHWNENGYPEYDSSILSSGEPPSDSQPSDGDDKFSHRP
jgi:LCP family protein required for cell wall assembly